MCRGEPGNKASKKVHAVLDYKIMWSSCMFGRTIDSILEHFQAVCRGNFSSDLANVLPHLGHNDFWSDNSILKVISVNMISG